MEPLRPDSAQVGLEEGITRKYLHLRPVYFPYPGVHCLNPTFGSKAYVRAATVASTRGGAVSLALIAPGLKEASAVRHYHRALLREIAMQGELSGGRNVLHWDFGSAAQIFNDVQLGQTVDQLQRIFPAGENPKSFFGIEIESTTATVQRVLALRRLGFTDLSITLGARGRKANLSQLVASVRDAEYQELQLTVLGGKSQPDDFTLARRLQDALCFGPDRIFIPGALLGKLHMRLLEDAGYRQISSELYVQRASGARPLILGAFRRFPFGDCSLAGHDLLGIGAGAISMLGAVCCQNERNIGEYCERLERGELPVAYGAVLSFDQLLRRAIMRMLLWDFALSTDAIDQVFFIEFNSYFNRQLQALRSMEEDGLLSLSDGWIRVHDKGRPLIRRICAVFAQTSDLA